MRKFNITINGITYEALVEEVPVTGTENTAGARKATPAMGGAFAEPEDLLIMKAPMPGTVLHLHVKEGQEVKSGDVLCTLEAMKMENAISAPRDAIVASVKITKGSAVNEGDILFTLR